MSLLAVAHAHEDMRYWFVADPAALLGNVGDFKTPDRVSAIIADDVTDDGISFERPAFPGGAIDAVFATMSKAEGEKVFAYISAKLSGTKTANPMVESASRGVVALWNLENDQVAVLAGDSGGSGVVQELWDEACRLAKIPPYEAGRVYASSSFSSSRVIDAGGELSKVAKAISIANPKARPRLG